MKEGFDRVFIGEAKDYLHFCTSSKTGLNYDNSLWSSKGKTCLHDLVCDLFKRSSVQTTCSYFRTTLPLLKVQCVCTLKNKNLSMEPYHHLVSLLKWGLALDKQVLMTNWQQWLQSHFCITQSIRKSSYYWALFWWRGLKWCKHLYGICRQTIMPTVAFLLGKGGWDIGFRKATFGRLQSICQYLFWYLTPINNLWQDWIPFWHNGELALIVGFISVPIFPDRSSRGCNCYLPQ